MSDALPALPLQHPRAAAARARLHAGTVAEVAAAVATNDVVVVGMAWNPHCGRARRLLDERGVKHVYLQYGSYLTGWRQRLALKLWAGWPTFPQVYVKGQLLGGASDLRAAAESGELAKLLA